MKTTSKILAFVLALALLLTACSNGSDTPTGDNSTPGASSTPTGDNSTPGTSSTPEATGGDSTPDADETTSNAPTWADPDIYDTEKKVLVDEWIEKTNSKLGIDIDSEIEKAFNEYGEYFNENMTPEALRTVISFTASSTPGLPSSQNISVIPQKSITLVNDYLSGIDKEELDTTVPSQNIAALALAATIFYEPNFGDIGTTVADLAAAFGLARSETESINPNVAGVFMDTYYILD